MLIHVNITNSHTDKHIKSKVRNPTKLFSLYLFVDEKDEGGAHSLADQVHADVVVLDEQGLDEGGGEEERGEEEAHGKDLLAVVDEVDDEVEEDGAGVAEHVRDQLEDGAGEELAAEDFEEAEEEGGLGAVLGGQLAVGEGALQDELLVVLVRVVGLVGGREFVCRGLFQVLDVAERK